MNCNCSKACPIPYCLDELQVGIVEPGLSGLILQVTDTVTGRVKKIGDLAPQSDGLLVVDVSTIAGFWASNAVYEIKILFSDESGCELVPITIGDETVTCINVETVTGMATRGILTLEGDNIEYLTFTHTRAGRDSIMPFTPTFADNTFTVNWGDTSVAPVGNVAVVNSGVSNSHSYTNMDPETFTVKIRGDFTDMTGLSMINAVVESIVLPPSNSLVNIDLSGNSIDIASISNALINLDNQGLANGAFDSAVQNPVAPPNALGAIAKTNLIAKGWTVTTD